MNIGILGDFYFGIDKESFCDLQLHIGNIRVEWNGPLPLKDRGRLTNAMHGRQTGKNP